MDTWKMTYTLSLLGMVFLGTFLGFALNNLVFPVKIPQFNFTCPTLKCPECPSYQLTCPEPEVKVDAVVQAKGNPNNIQAPHYENLSYYFHNKTFCIPSDGYLFITGSSMQPTFFTGNILIFKKFNASEKNLKEGQIIAFIKDDKLISHRIKGVYDSYVLTQGDNALYEETVPYEDIKYVVIGVVYE